MIRRARLATPDDVSIALVGPVSRDVARFDGSQDDVEENDDVKDQR